MALTAAAAPAKGGAAWQVSQAVSIWWWASVVPPAGSIPRSPPTTIRTATKATAIRVPGTQRVQKPILQDMFFDVMALRSTDVARYRISAALGGQAV